MVSLIKYQYYSCGGKILLTFTEMCVIIPQSCQMFCPYDKTPRQADNGWDAVSCYQGFASLITEWPITVSMIGAESNPSGYVRRVLYFYSMCQNKREASEK